MTLQDEIRRRRERNLPPLTQEEERQFTQNLADTAAADARMSQVGSVKTTMRGGAKVISGPYKGMPPAAARFAAQTGAPVPTGKSGYVRGGPLSGGAGLPARTPSAAPNIPAGGRMVPGRSTGSTVYVPPGEKAWFETTPASAGTAPAQSSSTPAASSAGDRVMSSLGITSPAAAAPRPQGKIDGIPAQQWLQEAANRRGEALNYGQTKPQTAPTPAAPVPVPAQATTGWNREGWPKTAAPGEPGYIPPTGAAPAPNAWRNAEQGPPRLQSLPDVNAGPPVAARTGYTAAAPTPATQKPATPTMPTTPGSSAAPVMPRQMDPALVTSKGFDKPDPTNPANWDYEPLPDKESTSLRRTAGRGEDRWNPFVAIPALFDGPNTGAGSQLPGFMGAQPTYPNAAARLKGDADQIKAARDKGFLRTRRIPGQNGEPATVQVMTPVLRGTNQRVTMPSAAPRPPGFVK